MTSTRFSGSLAKSLVALGVALGSIVATLVGCIILLLVWGFSETRLLSVEEIEAELPHLPADWDGQRVAVLGDFQAGLALDNDGTVETAVARALEAEPAAILLLGDFVYRHGLLDGSFVDPEKEIARVQTLLRPVQRSGVPAFAVLGNHDWGVSERGGARDSDRARRVREMLENLGINVLQNQDVALRLGSSGQVVHVVGIGSAYAGEADPERAFDALDRDAARIVIMHNPISFRDLSSGQAPLAFAGHTHGGQIRLPWTPSWTWLGWFRERYPAVAGWADELGAEGNRLYVNRGIGMSLLPLRINCLPELTLVTLRAQRPESQ